MKKMTPETRLAHLRNARFFSDLSEERRAFLAGVMTERRFAKDQVIYQKGDCGGALFLVTDGCIRVMLSAASGREIVLAEAGRGETVGAVSALDGGVRPTGAVAACRSRVLALSRRHLTETLADGDVSAAALRHLCGRMRRSVDLIETASLCDLGARLARQLLLLAEAYGLRQPDGILIRQKISHQRLATTVNASRPKVSLRLGEWRAQGIIAVQDGAIKILDVGRMRLRAQTEEG